VQLVDGNPGVHFALEMNKRKESIDAPTRKRVNLPALHGVSGGGVWSMRPEHNHLYPTCARALAGIIIEDWESKSLAKAIRAEFGTNSAFLNWFRNPLATPSAFRPIWQTFERRITLPQFKPKP
jgi:hypothetical protein